MKKRILSVLALVVLAAMLFSSCAINYADEDMSQYISIEESGYKGITLSEKIDKVIVHDEDLRKQIFVKLRKEIKDAATESGLIEKFDEVFIHTFAIDHAQLRYREQEPQRRGRSYDRLRFERGYAQRDRKEAL